MTAASIPAPLTYPPLPTCARDDLAAQVRGLEELSLIHI